jgi:hypothetical protein
LGAAHLYVKQHGGIMTIQASDGISYEGVPCYLKSELHLPESPRLVTVSDQEARATCSVCFTTACWRNFVAEWEIREGRLYLVNLTGKYRLTGAEPMAAEWISRTLHINEEEVITDFWDEDYNSGAPRAFTVEVERGVVMASTYVQRARNAA